MPESANVAGYRLSPHQRVLWPWQSESPIFQVQGVVLFKGTLDSERLRAALVQVVTRHEILRTTFKRPSWMKFPVQVINGNEGVELERPVLESANNGSLEGKVEALFAAGTTHAFDLAQGPLLHAALVQHSPTEHLLYIALPAVCGDSASLERLAEEIGQAYAGEEELLEEEPLQYVQFSEWQHDLLAEEDAAEEREYWSRLVGLPPKVLPIERLTGGEEEATFRPHRELVTIQRESVLELEHALERQGVTLGDGLLASWQLLLGRLEGSAQVVVHRLFDGRKFDELQEVVGLVARYLPVATDPGADPSFAEVWQEVKGAVEKAELWQEYYSERSSEDEDGEEGAEPAEAADPAFLFEYRERPAGRTLRDLSWSLHEERTLLYPFKLRLVAVRSTEDLRLEVHYDTRRFSRTVMRRLTGWFEALLEGGIQNPEASALGLGLLRPSERHQLLVEWSTAERRPEDTEFFHRLFTRCAHEQPDASAVVFGDEVLSYGQLDRESNQLARYLRGRGVGPEVRVGLCLERSVVLPLGILGILKAGASYVPVDPLQPEERLADMLKDAGAAAVICQEALRGKLSGADIPLICLDSERQVFSAETATDPEVAMRPDHLAYVIYTSGSTGRPKGVMIRHRSLKHLATALGDVVDRGQGRLRVGWNASAAFDASIKQLVQLLAGHTLHFVPDSLRIDGLGLGALITQRRLDWLDATPAQLRMLLQAGWPGSTDRSTPIRLLVGGEGFPEDLWGQLRELPSVDTYNVYGPTECTVDTAVCRLSPSAPRPVLGRPLGEVEVYLVDRRLRPVPAGVPGELVVGGRGVARGYLGRSALTAENFVPNPFNHQSGGRLYRTGDLVRFEGGGALEFLGRIDHQVKIRGVRIELGEIEALLGELEGVREAVVVAWRASALESRLVAYWVAAGRRAPKVEELREALLRRLPETMVPAVFVELPELPLTRNGKVDRRALPEPDLAMAREERPYVAPRTMVEETLAGIWSEVLQVEQVGVGDNFFDLGGHSLLATQLISRVRKAFQVELELRALFEAPGLAALAEKVEEVRRSGADLEVPPIERSSEEGSPPLSFSQERLWFLDQLQPGNAFYNIPHAVRLVGRLDTAALGFALDEILRRHEVLRTGFPTRGGKAQPVVFEVASQPLPLLDLSHLPEETRQLRLQERVAEEARLPFDLSRGPLWRTTLIRLGEREHALLSTQHHIISDAWSTGLLIDEVKALYGAALAGEAMPLPELPVQYGDYARWQRNWLTGEALESQLDYWRQRLGGAPPILELPTDFPRPAMPTFRGSVERLDLGEALTESLRSTSRTYGVTLFMTLLAAFQVLLARYSGQQDVCLGTPIAGRNRLEIEGLIGCFLNTLVLRVDSSGAPSFADLLERVREAALEAHSHQDLPFEKLVEELRPERSLSHMPLFQVWFTLQNAPRDTLELPELELSALEANSETSKFDLNLSLAESPRGLVGSLEYSTDLFSSVSMERLREHFSTLLSAVVQHSEAPLSTLSLLRDEERQELLAESPAKEYPFTGGIHRLFEAAAERHSSEVALVHGELEMSYGELDRRANQLARYLVGAGVGAGDRVGIFLEHGVGAAIAPLAILKAGAGYIPFDPHHPPRHSEHMLEDAGLALFLTEERLEGQLVPETAPVLYLDRDWPRIAAEESSRLSVEVLPESRAYVIYTSGSTGVPKGVEISHGALSNYVHWASEMYLRGERPSFALYSSLAFDLTLTSIYPPLVNGCRVVIYRGLDGEPAVLEAVRDNEVEVLKLTPSHLALIKDRDLSDSRIRRLIVGGEALTTELAEAVSRAFGGEVEILNEYGPTEATVGCMIYRFDPAVDRGVAVPIGDPAANTGIYLLGPGLEPVAENVTGELFIAGQSLARGYLNRPGRTAESFLPNPFQSGERMYRTGDLARRSPAGDLVFQGRRGSQVKYHGYRLELDGVRALLNQVPGIRNSVIRVLRDAEGREVLVAYYVSRQPQKTGDLRDFLAERMYEETLPSFFVHLRRLPLTINGKVHFEALPGIDEIRGQLQRTFVAPRTKQEEKLAEIWSQVLSIERVGLDDNFFELGGHSLLATQVVSRVQEALGVELPLRWMFERPTLRKFAERLEGLEGGETESSTPPAIEPIPREGGLPLSFAQERLAFLEQMQPGTAFYNIPSGVRLLGTLNLQALHGALQALVERHEVLRTVLDSEQGVPRQVIQPAETIQPSWMDFSSLPEEEREAALSACLEAEAGRPFDLEKGPLFRPAIVRVSAEEHVLLLTQHHLISDGWSIGILVEELASLYTRQVTGSGPELPALEIQYADFAIWQRRWLEGGILEAQLAYWKEQLAGLEGVLELPTDRPRPAVMGWAGAEYRTFFPETLKAGLERISHERGTTLFMTLLAAFQVYLSRITGERDLAVGTPIAGRHHLATERLLGFFVNTLVLRGDLSGSPSFHQFLEGLREIVLAAYSHQDLPFEKLVEELQPERSLSHSPIFQVMFELSHADSKALALPDLEVQPLRVELGSAKFDLTLNLAEGEGAFSALFSYRKELFDGTTIRRMSRSFESLLEALVEHPDRRIEDLDFLAPVERQQLLREWNDSRRPQVIQRLAHEMILFHSANSPDAIAIGRGRHHFTYRRLCLLTRRLATRLQKLGVVPERRVVVFAERSWEQVVGLVGILRAGGVYVPLDPAYPGDRLERMLADSGADVVLVQESLLGNLPQTDRPVLSLDPSGAVVSDFEESGDDFEEVHLTDQSLAYVMFTSGSTGVPKGVSITHGGLRDLILWHLEARTVTPEDRAVLESGPSFDASIWEIFPYLARCLPLFIVEEEDRVSAPRLVSFLVRERITLCHLPTPIAELVFEEEWPSHPALHALLLGGDRLHGGPRQDLTFSVFNCYGPTECTVLATQAELTPNGPLVPPIGRPVANSEIYLLDPSGLPVPFGARGDLHIGAVGLARGYLGRAAETASRFVPNPFSDLPGRRLYRTGDLACYLPDGNLHFLGRTDHQIKLSGVRIEPGEIAGTLMRHAAVRDALVMLRPNPLGGQLLAAYLVVEPTEDAALSAGASGVLEEIQEFARNQLPAALLPSAWVALDAMPLTANGKVDRRALPDPDFSDGNASDDRPTTEVEALLIGIWEDVLDQSALGVGSHFFLLGGHSLLAMQVISRVREYWQIDLPLRTLFETPTVAGLAERIEQTLTEAGGLEAPPLVPVERDGELPLSFAQQRLWFLDQLQPGNPFYNITTVLDLHGRLNFPALAAALSEIQRRHEVLRTAFSSSEGRAHQVVQAAEEVPIPMVDLSALEPSMRQREAVRLGARESRRPFDLSRGPMVRILLLRLGEEEHRGQLSLHHIVSDGWSSGVLIHELATLYSAFAAGQPSPLEELPVQYADFASWQRSWLEGEVMEHHFDYWRQRLAGADPILALPTDRPRPAVANFEGAAESLRLDADLTNSLRELGRREGTTLFMTLLAAFQVLVGRTAGQLDVSLGAPVAGRDRLEIEGLIGFFVNTLVLRGELGGSEGAPSFRRLLDRVRETTLGAFAHQDLPFEKLVEELQPERDANRNPLFQATFALQNASQGTLELPGLRLEMPENSEMLTRFDLECHIREIGEGSRVALTYRTDLFDPTTIRRLAERYRTLLEGATADPERRIDELPLLTPGEREQMLVDWNQTEAVLPDLPTVHALFSARAAAEPEAIAVVLDGGGGVDASLSYGDLDRRANQLAHHLRDLGVGPETRVGIDTERSLEMMVGLLGILKAGAAFVPLEAGHPDDRLAFQVADAEVEVLLASSSQAPRFAELVDRVLVYEEEAVAIASQPIVDPSPEMGASHAVYVVYTSGSTGRPKGVVIPHLGVLRLLFGSRFADLSAERCILQGAPVAFDASTFELWGALLHGGRLVLLPERVPTARVLGQIHQRQGIDTLWLTAALFNAVVDEDPLALEGVEQLIVGGEALSVPHIRRYREHFPHTRLLNGYGPTESTTFACCHPIPAEVERTVSTLPIGRPIANTRTYVLDELLQPAPCGVFGELYIGGAGLARGYLSRPGLTAERFLPDPFAHQPGERLYRTGDLVRYSLNGEIEYLGRLDHQVKVRGFRVELGEIEVVLGEHPAVREVVVSAMESAGTGKQLVAYVVSGEEDRAAAAELRAFLAERVPEPMVPSFFVELDELPLNANGKVDRKALPAVKKRASERHGKAPSTPTQELIAGIWCEVLGVEAVGLEDSFFELGGHSLLATRVTSRIQETFGIELSLLTFFESPTLGELAEQVEGMRTQDMGEGEGTILPIPRDQPLPLSFAQQRLWFVQQLEPQSAAYNISMAIRLKGSLGIGALAQSLRLLVERHEVLRTTFEENSAGVFQRIRPGGLKTLPVVDLGSLDAERSEAQMLGLAKEESRTPFDLAHGPILRAALLRLGAERHVLLLSVHHIAGDGWTLRVLLREMMTLYQALLAGRPSPLPELAIQYADYAAWQRSYLRGERLEALLTASKERLEGVPTVLELPADHPRREGASFEGRNLQRVFPTTLTTALKELGRREGATLFMVLLAAFDVLLHHWIGEEEFLVGTDIANRNRTETEPLIGFFVNQLVLRADLTGNPDFVSLLGRVRRETLAAYDQQDLPFDKLVESLGFPRDPGRNPLFQVKLVLQNLPPMPKASTGLRLSSVGGENRSSKFDLLFNLVDSEEGLMAAIEYDSQRFKHSTIDGLVKRFEQVLNRIAQAPEAPLTDLVAQIAAAEEERTAAEQKQLAKAKAGLFSTVRRKRLGKRVHHGQKED